MEVLYGLLLCLCLTLAASLPTKTAEEVSSVPSYYASNASQIIATNLLKSYIDIDGNQVHSPLGVASILAVLAEGAAGETFAEFNKVFGYPKERSSLRSSFKRILAQYQHHELFTEPSFQTWLYIYRDYNAREEYKRLVRENYFVEVRDINREEYDWSEPNTSLDAQTTTVSNSKDVVGFETLKLLAEPGAFSEGSKTSSAQDSYGEEVLEKAASKFDRVVDDKQFVEKPVILDEIKKEQQKQEEKKQEDNKQEAAEETRLPLDAVTEQSQVELEKLVKQEEKPIAKGKEEERVDGLKEQKGTEAAIETTTRAKQEDIKTLEENLETKDKNKREDDLNLEENETVQEVEKIHKHYNEESAAEAAVPIQEILASNEPEKVSLPLQKLEIAVKAASKEAGEIMLALESHISSARRIFGARSLFRKDDITSALSANSITGRELGAKTKMLLFNGLYYRGNWAQPFLEQPGGSDFFFMTADDAMKTPMMHTTGQFHSAELPHLNAKAVCLRYENKKYAMLIMLPNEVEGLRSVIEKLQPADFKYIKEHATEKELHITIPKFQVEETSRSESMLKSLGLQRLFTRDEADLSLLSEDHDLHVDEIVQFVNVRVDEGGSDNSGLSATYTQGRSGASQADNFEINRPFLYFVVDCEEDFVIVSGKIYAPEFKDELPISIEVELE